MNILIFNLLVFLFITLPLTSHANEAQYRFADHVKFQYAGEIGTIATGIGKNFGSFYSLDFFYGYVPEAIGGTEIETFSLKNDFKLFNSNFFKTSQDYYFGVNIYHVTSLRYQTSRGRSFPDEYYRLGSVRALFYLGIDIRSNKKYRNHSGFFEAGINDIVLTNYINNSDVINPLDYASLALGYKFDFN